MRARNKVSAEFSMSSLTDIIFLLLIFFMLTSSMVQINMDIPESDSQAVASQDMAVMFKNDGTMTYNGKKSNFKSLKSSIRKSYSKLKDKKNATVMIIPEVGGVPFKKVQSVMKIANELKLKCVIATKPRK